MKVFEQAEQKWQGVFKCTGYGKSWLGCHAKLQIAPSDFHITKVDGLRYIAFNCPSCGTETIVDKDLIPEQFHLQISKQLEPKTQNDAPIHSQTPCQSAL